MTEPGRLELTERPRPSPGPGQVVMRVAYCGICGTDLHALHGGLLPPGSILGHECAGVITAVGAGAERKPGDRVVVRPSFICGECDYCRAGDFRLCREHFRRTVGVGAPGAFADEVLLEEYMAIPLPDSVRLDHAALIEPLASGLLATRIADLRDSDRVVVLGAGPIGLCVLACARAAGVSQAVVIERSRTRGQIAGEMGADCVLGLEDAEASGPAWLREVGADAVFECGGSKGTFDAAFKMARPGGRVVIVALYDQPMALDLPAIIPKGLTVHAAIGSRADDFQRAVDLVAADAVPVRRLISEIAPLDAIAQAFERLDHPEDIVKILIAPNHGDRDDDPLLR